MNHGDHVHVLDWALHLDESTPHIHERHVFDCENKYGEVAPQQEKALGALGFNLPDPDKPLSRRNNRKITFDAACRKMLFEIAKRHGLELEEEAEYGNRKYLEKQDFILAKQKEQLAAQQNKLDELTLKVSDMETLLKDVSAAAYEKAVEVVTDVVRTETRKEDMEMLNTLGYAPLISVQVMSNAGMVGAACGIFLLSKNEKVRQACRGAIPTSFLCVGEPVIYGVCLPSGFGFITGSIGAGVGGALIRLFNVSFNAMGMAGMSALPLVADGKYLYYLISYFGGAIAACVLTYIVGKARHYE